jgi:hypothetical protein
VRRVLRTGRWLVFKALEGFRDVIGHGNVAGTGVLIPLHVDTGVEGGIPVDFGVVMETKAREK